MYKKIFNITAILLLVTLVSCNPKSTNSIVKPGHKAPDFSLKTLDAKKIGISDFSNNYVLINFWASWCAPCVEELPDLEKLHLLYKDKGLKVVTIAVDDNYETLEEIKSELKLTLPILIDGLGVVKDKFKVRAFPETYLIDREGKLRLITDPNSLIPELKIRGPRLWVSNQSLLIFNKLLELK